MKVRLPSTKRGRRSAAEAQQYQRELREFAEDLKEIDSTLDFKIGARGWCYILEEHGLTKGDFDRAERLINDCRKTGLLPIDFTREDDNRAADNVERNAHEHSPAAFAAAALDTVWSVVDTYRPLSYWNTQQFYVEMVVEKIDLKGLFGPICKEHHVVLTNSRGWSDINSRAAMMGRFKEHEEAGRTCVLLAFNDHDPGGLAISGSIKFNLEDLSPAVGWWPTNLIVERFGLNFDFIEAQRLSWIDNLETSSGGHLDDPGHRDHAKPYVQTYLQQFGARKVEANALVVRAEAGRQLCRAAIEKYVDQDAARNYRADLDAARAQVRRLLPATALEVFSGGDE